LLPGITFLAAPGHEIAGRVEELGGEIEGVWRVAAAGAKVEDEGHFVRVWKRPLPTGETTVLGLYRADTETELHAILGLLPLYQWMHVTVTPLEAHPNDPAAAHASAPAAKPVASVQLPDPQLTLLYRLDATLGERLDLGETPRGHRRIVPLTGGTRTASTSVGRRP
jgi:muconolactone delta-isomerase